MRVPVMAGNWKMHKNSNETKSFIHDLRGRVEDTEVKVILCVPFTSISAAKDALAGTKIGLGAQNMSWEEKGAFTGEISPDMLLSEGVEYVIIGHSERRAIFKETDDMINKKVVKALEKGLIPILCVGETLEEREEHKAKEVTEHQLKEALKGVSVKEMEKIIVAYEPVWAIGTGKTASPEDANEMAVFIRETLKELYGEETSEEVIIQYGGSVKPGNVEEIMNQSDVDGALVGGASLKVEDFEKIVNF